jgi:hypothetical protein
MVFLKIFFKYFEKNEGVIYHGQSRDTDNIENKTWNQRRQERKKQNKAKTKQKKKKSNTEK